MNVGKTKIMPSAHNAPKATDSSEFPCGVCSNGVGSNSIQCNTCKLWVHKRCTNLKGRLKPNPDFKCKKCKGEITDPVIPAIGPVVIDGESIEIVDSFCYLGDLSGQRGGCHEATTARIRSAWKSFRELLPMLTCRGISLKTRGHHYNACVRSVMLYASETWPATKEDLTRIERNDKMMIRWICSAKLADKIPSEELRMRLGLNSIDEMLHWGRLRWYGHLLRMTPDVWPRRVMDVKVGGKMPRGRPRKTWLECVGKDMTTAGIKPELAQDRHAWRRAITPRRQDKDCVQPSETGNNAR